MYIIGRAGDLSTRQRTPIMTLRGGLIIFYEPSRTPRGILV